MHIKSYEVDENVDGWVFPAQRLDAVLLAEPAGRINIQEPKVAGWKLGYFSQVIKLAIVAAYPFDADAAGPIQSPQSAAYFISEEAELGQRKAHFPEFSKIGDVVVACLSEMLLRAKT